MNEHETKERVEVMAARILKDNFFAVINTGKNWAEIRVEMKSSEMGTAYVYGARTLNDAFAAFDDDFRDRFPTHYSRRRLSDPRDDERVGNMIIIRD